MALQARLTAPRRSVPATSAAIAFASTFTGGGAPLVALALAAVAGAGCVAPAAPPAGSLVSTIAAEPEAPRSIGVAPDSPPAKTILRPTWADLHYGSAEQPAQTLDLYLPPAGASGPAPLIIWIHGGGLRMGDKRSMPRRNFGPAPRPTGPNGPYQIQVPDVAALTAKGYAVASINYRLGANMRDAAVPAVHDGKAAVRFLRANAGAYHLDSDRFAVWGNSAGGYMAAMLGVTGDQRTVFDASQLDDGQVSSAVQAVVVWFGAEDRLERRELSIAGYLGACRNLPAFLIVNGDADPVISPQQARRLHEALLAAGARSTLVILPGAGHEDPAFMATQMLPTFAFLDSTFGR